MTFNRTTLKIDEREPESDMLVLVGVNHLMGGCGYGEILV
jgi:hypothetical protein